MRALSKTIGIHSIKIHIYYISAPSVNIRFTKKAYSTVFIEIN